MDILVADHHPVFRKGLKCMMKNYREFNFVGYVDDGSKLLEKVETHSPDILILEIDLPNCKGVSELRTLRERFPRVKVLVVSCHPEQMYAISSVRAGAKGYISKIRKAKEIRNALITVSEGKQYVAEELRSSLNGQLKEHNRILKFKKLSTREIEVLNLLSRGQRNKEIAQTLNINEKTVSTYKTRLLKKLNVDNIADLITHSRLLQLNKK
jgi:DNA-binding NarL/FixJ family response regulator